MNGEVYATIVALVLLICYGLMRHDPASPGPDAEKASGARQGESPTEGAVVSGPAHLQLEQAPACDRASDLSPNDSTNVLLAERSPVVVRSAAAGAPAVSSLRSESAVIYRWVRPAEGKRLSAHGWWLEHVDPRYGTWLVKKEERWP